MAEQKYKRGRLPPRRTAQTMRSAYLMAAALDPLGKAPAACNDYLAAVRGIECGMLGNDKYGCCTCSDTGHTLMIRTANAGQIVVPTTDQVLDDLYAVLTKPPFNRNDPSTDTGLDEVTVCQYLRSTGFLGHKADNFATIDPSNLEHIKWSVYLFGTCRIGLNLPNYAEDQFETGKPWDVSSTGDQEQGGHDVPIVDYRNGLFYVTTWGRWDQPVTPAFLNTFCEEAHPELHFDWIRQQGAAPSNFDLNALEARLKEIAE